MNDLVPQDPVERFIAHWSKSSGAERANFQSFAKELCSLIEVPEPEPARADPSLDSYTFEHGVKFKDADGSESPGRIDLYKKGCFVLEAKQSRLEGRPKAVPGQKDLFVTDTQPQGRRSANRAWDVLMMNARRQAEEYAKALPTSHGWPPFVLVCDVGHCIEVYADFSGQGKNYAQFPDRQGFRVYLEDLRKEDVRARLKQIWTEPQALDPAKESAKVTRQIARRLADVSKALEEENDPEQVALFLMRCVFTMFAEDVELLPKASFTELLAQCKENPKAFVPMVEQLWTAMDKGDFAFALAQKVRRFNGHLFANARAMPLGREEIGELHEAAQANWREVEPAIFGTLLEQALDENERVRLGAHYTPRAYVERLVVATIMEPLRAEWANVQATAERLKDEKRPKEALAVVKKFHDELCNTRVLDPACGTGNFLYVSMELMKRLEGEVLESLLDLGGQEALSSLERHTVDPHQFLGLEVNPRAAAIAELVIWLGYLQWHFRTKGGPPSEPILRDFKNIEVKDAVLTWDGYPVPKIIDGKETYPNARRPDWPEAEFIVGNPPFTGGKDIRGRWGDDYAEALWGVHKHINESADYVMYWWDQAADIVAKRKAQRFGLVTTNSITQVFSRRVVAARLSAKKSVSLVMAIPDHPWTKATPEAAAVRIAMTVGRAGNHGGIVREVTRETALDTDQPEIEFSEKTGRVNADLTVGTDVTSAEELRANQGLCCPGVKLHGDGFIVTQQEAAHLGLGKRPALEEHIRPYRNGRDLTRRPRGVLVIDLFGLTAEEVRHRFPEVYQHVKAEVKEKVITNEKGEKEFVGRDWNNRDTYRNFWWLFGEPRRELRPALARLNRYIATVETASHRVFQFLDSDILPDNMLICIALDDGFPLGVLSSRIHVVWTLNSGATLEDRPRYSKSRCFDPFPFPDCSEELKQQTRAVAEELDAHRKARQAEHPKLTLTQMYNVLKKLNAGEPLSDAEERIKDEGLVLILKELHERLDRLVFQAYGWPEDLSDEEILARLVALNKERAAEEKTGNVRWLRPDYQIPRFGSDAEKARLKAEKEKLRAAQAAMELEADEEQGKPRYPTDNELAETAAVMSVLATATRPISIDDIAATFAQGRQIKKRVAMTILALARLGHLASPDGGQSFSLRRTA
jgi:hypothetical protein